jgi:hypothetical protein
VRQLIPLCPPALPAPRNPSAPNFQSDLQGLRNPLDPVFRSALEYQQGREVQSLLLGPPVPLRPPVPPAQLDLALPLGQGLLPRPSAL